LTAADYLSLARIPLGIAFLLLASNTAVALAVLVAAGLSDVLDGWVARRRRPAQGEDPAHHRGDWLDPLCDKLFVAAVAIGLYLTQRPPAWLLLLMMTREILQTISITFLRLVPALHARSRDYNFRAHPVGKATTVVQFMTGAALVLDLPMRVSVPLAGLTAGLGVLSLAIYVDRLRRTTPKPTAGGSGPR
jgi:phosphatidylglycerophosphate synthase